MTINEATFFAWLDGELPADEAQRVGQAVAADPELRERADAHRALTAGLRTAFAQVSEAPLPASLADVAQPAERKVIPLAEARERREGRTSSPIWRQAAAMAATLVLGLVVGHQLTGPAAGPVETRGGKLVAGATLASALDTRLASAPAGAGAKIGLTFRDRSGAICRTFTENSSSGLACRDGRDWRLLGLFQAGDNGPSDYRMAASGDPKLLTLVDERIAGEPFDAAAERAALQRGWR